MLFSWCGSSFFTFHDPLHLYRCGGFIGKRKMEFQKAKDLFNIKAPTMIVKNLYR